MHLQRKLTSYFNSKREEWERNRVSLIPSPPKPSVRLNRFEDDREIRQNEIFEPAEESRSWSLVGNDDYRPNRVKNNLLPSSSSGPQNSMTESSWKGYSQELREERSYAAAPSSKQDWKLQYPSMMTTTTSTQLQPSSSLGQKWMLPEPEMAERPIQATTVTTLNTKRVMADHPHHHPHPHQEVVPAGCRAIPPELKQLLPYGHLNFVQSSCFHQAYETDDSMLIVAPTGSGKTGIFELTIARLFSRHYVSTSQEALRKVVYLAPLRALVQERRDDWQKRFGEMGLKCVELTSDTHDEEGSPEAMGKILQNADIILATPEKWDSITRKWKSIRAVMNQICLVCVDEIHTLNENSRGPTLEAVLTRMKTIQILRQTAHLTRFVAASATIPNPEDIADWLAIPPTGIRIFGPEHRPVPLETHVIGYAGKKNAFLFERDLRFKLYDVIAQYHGGRPSLVFCATRKSVTEAAQCLLKRKSEYPLGKGIPLLTPAQTTGLAQASRNFDDQALGQLIKSGIGYYHSGLTARDRSEISRLFLQSDLRVVCTTSALAVGINLPAYLVVIMGTQVYRGGGYEEIDELSVIQMVGRAGRPQFDTRAVAVIMTEVSKSGLYQTLVAGRVRVESQLEHKLAEHINSEIVLETIRNLDEAVVWLQSTFYYITAIKADNRSQVDASRLFTLANQVLEELAAASVIHFEGADSLLLGDDDEASTKLVGQRSVTVRPIGIAMSKYYVAFETMKRLVTMPAGSDLSVILQVLCEAAEFEEIVLRRDEKTMINTLNKKVRFPLAGKVSSAPMKIQVLLQAALAGVITSDTFSLYQEAHRIMSGAPRIMKCAVEVLLQDQKLITLQHALLLLQSCSGGAWFDSGKCLQQLTGIGATMLNHLAGRGIVSFESLMQCSAAELEALTHRHPPFGTKVLSDARHKWPRPALTVECERKGGQHAVRIQLKVNAEKCYDSETVLSCAYLVVGDIETDTLLLYRKMISFRTDIDCGLDVQLPPGKSIDVYLLNDRFIGMNRSARVIRREGVPAVEYSNDRDVCWQPTAIPSSSKVKTTNKATKKKKTPAKSIPNPHNNPTPFFKPILNPPPPPPPPPPPIIQPPPKVTPSPFFKPLPPPIINLPPSAPIMQIKPPTTINPPPTIIPPLLIGGNKQLVDDLTKKNQVIPSKQAKRVREDQDEQTKRQCTTGHLNSVRSSTLIPPAHRDLSITEQSSEVIKPAILLKRNDIDHSWVGKNFFDNLFN